MAVTSKPPSEVEYAQAAYRRRIGVSCLRVQRQNSCRCPARRSARPQLARRSNSIRPSAPRFRFKHAEDGTVSGDAGSLAYILGAARDTGRWWIAEDQLCHQWSKWFDGATHCLRLKKQGRHVEWRRDDGKTGTATIISRATQLARQSGTQSGIGLDQPAAAFLDAPSQVSPRASMSVTAAEQAPPAKVPIMAKTAKPAPSAAKPRVAALNSQTEVAPPLTVTAPKANAAPAPLPATTAKPPVRPVAKPPSVAPAPAPAAAKPSAPPPAAAAPPVISFRVAGVAPSDVLRVRKGPSTEHDPVGAIPPDGRDVRVVGPCQQDWCPVRHNGIGGWVNSYYLAEDLPRMSGSISNYAAGQSRR